MDIIKKTALVALLAAVALPASAYCTSCHQHHHGRTVVVYDSPRHHHHYYHRNYYVESRWTPVHRYSTCGCDTCGYSSCNTCGYSCNTCCDTCGSCGRGSFWAGW
jgi:hypothetical protein